MLGRLAVFSIASILLLSTGFVHAKVQQESLLVYAVEGSPPNERLVLQESESFPTNCEQQPFPGCINVPKYYVGVIGFLLPGSDRKCVDGEDKWRLASVRIGGVGYLTDPQPKPDTWGNLDELYGIRAASDFGADRETGETRYQKRKRILDALWILDANWYLVSTWYQITATHCSDPSRTASAEGRIDNRGQR
jgi:hypothetical protein